MGNTQGGIIFGGNQGATQGGNNLFGGQTSTPQAGNNLFGGGQGGGNIFSIGGTTGTMGTTAMTQYGQGQYGTSNQTAANTQFSQINESQLYHLFTSPQDQQKKLFEAFTPEYLKSLIAFYRKTLEPSKMEKLQLSLDNPLRNEKLTKVAGSLNIKTQVVQLKKLYFKINVESETM